MFFTTLGIGLFYLLVTKTSEGAKPLVVKGTTGWGSLEISPNVLLSAVYREVFRVSIFEKQNHFNVSDEKFYYSPALIFDPSSITVSYARLEKRYEVRFKTLMWDSDFEQFVQQQLTSYLKREIPRERIQVLPIEQVRIESVSRNPDFEIDNRWVSYASQKGEFDFRFFCQNNETAMLVTEILQENPVEILDNVVVYYSLLTQRTSRRKIAIKSEHADMSYMYSSLNQRLPDADAVYMTVDDMNQMTQEISSNVLLDEVLDEDFISHDQSLTIAKLLETLMQVRPTTTNTFDDIRWESVFWQEENARPDKISKTFNDLYEKSEETLKQLIKSDLQSSSSHSTSGGGSVGAGWFQVSGYLAESGSQSSLNSQEQAQLMELLTERREVVEFQGEKIRPRPMTLNRVNMASMRGKAEIASTQVSVSKSSSELNTGINILPDFATGSALSKLAQIEKLVDNNAMATTGTIRMVPSSDIPRGWLPCNGEGFNCTDYAELCKLLGFKDRPYGFTPDFSGRFPAGFDANGHGGFASIIGAFGGEEEHWLTEDEMPAHRHDVTRGSPQYSYVQPCTGTNCIYDGLKSYNSAWDVTQYTGTGVPHNNLPPYHIVAFIIKT